jgi:hypothetical protein
MISQQNFCKYSANNTHGGKKHWAEEKYNALYNKTKSLINNEAFTILYCLLLETILIGAWAIAAGNRYIEQTKIYT